MAHKFKDVASSSSDPVDLVVSNRWIGVSLHYIGQQAAAKLLSPKQSAEQLQRWHQRPLDAARGLRFSSKVSALQPESGVD